MSHLPIAHLTLYKHGVGYFQRRGNVTGDSLALTFRREEMDDILKSLTVLDYGGGKVLGIDYDTPQKKAERLQGCSVALHDTRSLRDLLTSLRGRAVGLHTSSGNVVNGLLVGLDEAPEHPLEESRVSILEAGSSTVQILPINRVEGVTVNDDTAADDLRFFLKTAVGQESYRSITIRLSPDEHDLQVSYIAPAPTWRVSYRLLVEPVASDEPEPQFQALLQGWGIFDNRLEEDLTGISLSFVAGMPISFVYNLYTPRIPRRPHIGDRERTLNIRAARHDSMEEVEAMLRARVADAEPPAPSPAELAGTTVQSVATGKSLGELFQYTVTEKVTVGRGQSAMVPIVSDTLDAGKVLVYDSEIMRDHPMAALRLTNSTGLTLEQGPVTVLDNGEYVGEGVLLFTPVGQKLLVPYAVELGVLASRETSSGSQLHSLQVRDGYLLQNMYAIVRTQYRLENNTTEPKTILIRSKQTPGHHLFDTPQPVEQSPDWFTFRVDVPPGESVEFRVQERKLRAVTQKLQDQTLEGLQRYFENNFLDQAAFEGLRSILRLYTEVSKLEAQIQEFESQRQNIFTTQRHIQGNLGALGTQGDEGRLRSRYVKQLESLEEQLAGLVAKIATARGEIKSKRAQIQQLIAQLESS